MTEAGDDMGLRPRGLAAGAGTGNRLVARSLAGVVRCAARCIGQLGPDRQPVIRPQVASGNFSVRGLLDCDAPLNGYAAILPVAQGLSRYADERR